MSAPSPKKHSKRSLEEGRKLAAAMKKKGASNASESSKTTEQVG